jgi:hypothetical protein
VAKSRRPTEETVRRRPDDDDDAPPRKGRRDDDDDAGDEGPIRPRRKRKSAAGPVKLVLRICACVAGAVALVILLYWVYTPMGTDYGLLCYFPPETTSLSGYDAGEGARNGKLKDVHETLLSNYKVGFSEKRFQDTGIVPGDVDKYLSGAAAGNWDEEKDLAPQDRRGGLTVIRFRRDVDQAKFIASFANNAMYKAEERTSKDGKTFHQLWYQRWVTDHFEREDDISFFFPRSDTLVYATTRREIQEAMSRQPGRVVVKGDMRELADHVDGQYFQASAGWSELIGYRNTLAYGLSFVDESVRNPQNLIGVTGSASWFASNGNEFLYASATLYSDSATANDVKKKLQASYDKMKKSMTGSDSKPTIEDPFNPKKPAAGAPGGFGGGGGGGMNEQTKDIIEALNEYSKNSRVYKSGRMVVVEGTIPHGMPEQGLFEKFWAVVGAKFRIQQTFGGFPGGGGMGPPGPGGPGGIPGAPGIAMPR